jgi:hypothetical protein
LTFPWNNQNTDWTSDNTSFTMYTTRTGPAIAQLVQWLEKRKDFRFPVGARDFLTPQSFHTGHGNHAASYSVGIGALSPAVKRLARKASHSPPSRTEVKNEWSCTSNITYALAVSWWIINIGTTSHSPYGVDKADIQG